MFVPIRYFRLETLLLVLGMVFLSLPLAAQTEPIDRSNNSIDPASREDDPVLEAEFPTSDERGDYQPSSPVHPTWEIVDRGLSGLNCYETFPPNQGSHRVVSRLFSRQVLEVTSQDEGQEVWVESSGKTWLSVRDPWSGQSCWVRAHKDFIKPIEENPEAILHRSRFAIEKSLGF
jgi:hypothetical protein